MDGLIFPLAALAAITLWIIAGVRISKHGGKKGVKFFFMHFGFYVLSGFILFFIIVYPVLNCSGFLCGLEEIIIFILLTLLVGIIWPLVLIIIEKRKFPRQIKSSDVEILDDI